jgi:mannosyltransferase OCH1-like enzyme
MIPQIIHQIWIGPNVMPVNWMKTWQEKNPNMKYELWDDKRIKEFDLLNQEQYDYYMRFNMYHGASDVARIEILERYGGIYIDADIECLESIENEDFMQKELFAVQECPGRIANGTIGAIKQQPVLREYIRRLSKLKPGHMHHPWRDTGGTVFTSCIEQKGNQDDIAILPTCSFSPRNKYNEHAPIVGKVYADHKWGTTLKLYEINEQTMIQ